MNNPILYCSVNINENNKNLIREIEHLSSVDRNSQFYIVNSLHGDKYTYPNSENFLVLLSPKHKIMFINLSNEEDSFNNFIEDFIEDLASLSDKFNYKNYIGRPRVWREELTSKNDKENLNNILIKNTIASDDVRRVELLISLIMGSINDVSKIGVSEPKSRLEKVKNNIILFDAEQTRFIYQNFGKKSVSIQGLSGTGKTELLLHKLKELYSSEEPHKIFVTCHNIALANSLRSRIPEFFNFMRVDKQIEWNKLLWVDRAWGSKMDKHSGIYSFICDFYGIPFLKYSRGTTYKTIFSSALEWLKKLDQSKIEYAFDYVLVDERQDFPNEFFELLELVTRKQIFIAGDIFQDIYENTSTTELNVDVVLNRCYRTDPRTLMFAHGLGIGLFEEKKLNWFDDSYWSALGYKLDRQANNEVKLTREPIRRFENLMDETFDSVIIHNTTSIKLVAKLLNDLKTTYSTISAHDIAIIILDDNARTYSYIDELSVTVASQVGWSINRAYETKIKEKDKIFVSNPNNVKGLEFPFVICITNSIKSSYRYRNVLYTMLTRSFIQSHLLVTEATNLDVLIKGLGIINTQNCIITNEPTAAEKMEIQNAIVNFNQSQNISYHDFLNAIFDEYQLSQNKRKALIEMISKTQIEQFNAEVTRDFILKTKDFLPE